MTMLKTLRNFAAASLLLVGIAKADVNLIAGWNLVGNGSTPEINVAQTFNDPSKYLTIWKWDLPNSNWSFFTPSLNAAELAVYAKSKGYSVLTKINSKEGFWVNAKAPTTLPTNLGGSGAILGQSDFQLGWNLLASADAKTPAEINSSLNKELNNNGKSIITTWAWDPISSNWKFYAPLLEVQGGNILSDYIKSKNYLNFNVPLSSADGFWMNIGVAQQTPIQRLDLTKVLQETTEWNTVYNSAVGDLNGDGLEDIVVSGWRFDNDIAYVWVFTQNADGTLTNSTDTMLPSHTHGGSQHVFIRDLDGDGRNDIFIPGFRDGSAIRPAPSTIFWGSTGSFVRQDFSEMAQAHGACIDDLNNDGRLDLVVSGAGVYYNQGNRKFTLDAALPNPKSAQGNNYFTACAVMHLNGNVLLALGNQEMDVNIGIDALLTYDPQMKFISKAVLPKNNINDDLISILAIGSKFVFVYNDNGHNLGVPRRELYDPATGQFTTIDVGLNNEYHAYLTMINNDQAIFFPGPGVDSRIYLASTLAEYKPAAFGDMANSVPGNITTWSVEGVTVYRNARNGRVFMLQLLEGNSFYIKEIQ